METHRVIPQFFYDIISRVLPGGIVMMAVSRALGESPGRVLSEMFQGAPALEESAVFLAVSFLILSYVSGQLLAPVSHLFEIHIVTPLLRLFRVREDILVSALDEAAPICPSRIREFILEEIGCDCSEEAASSLHRFHAIEIFVWFDWLQIYRPDVGARLAKHRAEYRMFGSLAVATLLALMVHGARALFTGISISLVALVPLFIFFLSVVGMTRMKLIFNWEVLHYYYVARSKKKENRSHGANFTETTESEGKG